jgi:CheY-like chemotaxis protein
MAGDRIALVIEQDLAVRDVAYLVLNRVGYRVVLAADLRHGVALVKAGLAPSLLIVDAAQLPVDDTCVADLPRVVVLPRELDGADVGDRDAVVALPATAAELGNAIQAALCRGFVRRRASVERARHARARSVAPAA